MEVKPAVRCLVLVLWAVGAESLMRVCLSYVFCTTGWRASPEIQQNLTKQPEQENRPVCVLELIQWCFCLSAPSEHTLGSSRTQRPGRFVLSVINRSWWEELLLLRDQDGPHWLRGIRIIISNRVYIEQYVWITSKWQTWLEIFW